VFGYHPREFAIQHFYIVEGALLTASHQVIVGRRLRHSPGIGDGLGDDAERYE